MGRVTLLAGTIECRVDKAVGLRVTFSMLQAAFLAQQPSRELVLSLVNSPLHGLVI